MKQILTALFVITASAATAEGEGRFITATISNNPKTIMVTDTKLGKVRSCRLRTGQFGPEMSIWSVVGCDEWKDVTK
tara:strand:- start:7 stop:237 length:231 start_codon:yes stop_codon:yes gene_type:complete